jgi:hypothetical protein
MRYGLFRHPVVRNRLPTVRRDFPSRPAALRDGTGRDGTRDTGPVPHFFPREETLENTRCARGEGNGEHGVGAIRVALMKFIIRISMINSYYGRLGCQLLPTYLPILTTYLPTYTDAYDSQVDSC